MEITDRNNSAKGYQDSIELITRTNGRYLKLKRNELEYCKAEGSYTNIKTRGQNELILVSKNLSCFESMFGSGFLRIHRS